MSEFEEKTEVLLSGIPLDFQLAFDRLYMKFGPLTPCAGSRYYYLSEIVEIMRPAIESYRLDLIDDVDMGHI